MEKLEYGGTIARLGLAVRYNCVAKFCVTGSPTLSPNVAMYRGGRVLCARGRTSQGLKREAISAGLAAMFAPTARFRPLLIAALGSTLFAAPAPESIPSPERVPLPKNYQTEFREVRASNKTAQTKLGTIYVNGPAAGVDDLAKLPYPNGSIVVMEWAEPVKGANGELLLDANGNWKKGEVMRVDVMRREKDFGAVYGDKRAGEWEFASYRPDGSLMSAPKTWTSCAECHMKAASRDYVFRGRFPEIEQK